MWQHTVTYLSNIEKRVNEAIDGPEAKIHVQSDLHERRILGSVANERVRKASGIG